MNNPEDTAVSSAFANVCDDSKQSTLNYRAFMDKFTISDDDTEAQANFMSIDPQYRKRFYVPEDAVPQLMKLLHICFKEGVINYLHEIQDTIAHSASGLVFEFKFVSEQSKIEFETVVPGFIRVLFKEILPKWIAFSPEIENHYCIYLATVKPEYDHSTQKYKATYRIIVPSVMLDPDVRFFIYHRVWHSVDLKKLFEKKLNYRIRDCFVRSARKAPLPLIGSCAPEETPLVVDSVRKVVVEGGICDGESASLSSLENKVKNVINEASINHPCERGIVEKGYYSATEACLHRMEKELEEDKQLFQLAYDDAKAAFVFRTIVDREIQTINDVIALLSDSRFDSFESWLEVMKALGSEGNRYHSIAVMVTKDRAKCRSDNRVKDLVTWAEFEKAWGDITKSTDRSKYSVNAIRYWASRDSPSHFARYNEDSIKRMLIRDIRDPLVEGRINHSHVSSYLHFIFKNMYITYNVTKTTVFWYEFVTEISNSIEPGQLYKWRELGTQPDSLFDFISHSFKEIAGKVHSDLKSLKRTLADDAGGKSGDYGASYIKSLYKTFHSAIGSIFNIGFKKSVIEDATVLFKQNHFIKQMNKTPHIMGVGNGVLEFDGPNVKLLTHYHTYPISLYTDTNYVPYDPNSKYVCEVMTMLESLVPDGEKDALHFILSAFSTSLDWFPKEALFLIIHGGGCHAPDTPIRMLDGSVQLVQHIRVGDVLMGDDHTPRVVQELFRGKAPMFRITPAKGEPFEVNDEHVLVLTFTDVERINRICCRGNKFHVEWYEHQEAGEPKKNVRSFPDKSMAITFVQKIQCERLVKNGDVIHIKVKDLLLWKPWWVRQSIVKLFRSDAIEYTTKSLPIDPYVLGMWIGLTNESIPNEYKVASSAQRLALLAGILDYTPDAELKRNRYKVQLTRKTLRDACIDLVRSLGLGAKRVSKWRLIIYGDIGMIPCRHLLAKQKITKSALEVAFKVESVGTGDYYGFELDGNHRYLTGDYLVHHNSNGKSVLLELLRRTLGECYAKKLPLSFITDQSRTRSSSTDSAMMLLKDARLAYYSESDRNEKVNIAKIKEITGGETLAARELFRPMENFIANCIHIVTTNHRFVIETTEHAVWRRFLSYKFKICFKHDVDPTNPLERKREPALISKIMEDKRYHEAFLSILIHYRSILYSKYEGQILKVPHPTVQRETEEYRQSEDIFQRFIMQSVYYYKGRQQSLDDLVANFRVYYRVESGGNPYTAQTVDLIHNFRNTILQKYITEAGGIYMLNDFYTCSEHDNSVAQGSVVFGTWIATQA